MSDIDDLEQDVEALNKEIDYLLTKRDDLKLRINQENKSKLGEHPLVKEFQSLFDSFPQLFHTLSQKTAHQSKFLQNPEPRVSPKYIPDKESPSKTAGRNLGKSGNTSSVFQHKVFDDSISSLIDTSVMSSPSKRKMRQNDAEHAILKQKVQLENAYRLFGITFFPVVEPGNVESSEKDNLLDMLKEMLGIRLEVYNENSSRFEEPHYILLKRSLKSNSWDLFKHTIPIYINVQKLFDTATGGFIISYQDVYLFAKSVYVQLTLGSKRTQQLQVLETIGLVQNLEVDLQAAVVLFSINGLKVRLFIKEEQIISCQVKNEDGTQPQLKREMEVSLLGSLQELRYKLVHLND